MDLFLIGITLGLIGKLCIAYAVLSAHSVIEHEHKIDAKVIRSFHREKIITLIGVVLLVLEYLFEVQFFGGFEFLLSCDAGVECLLLGGE